MVPVREFLCFLLVVAIALPASSLAAEQQAMTPPRLTEAQITRFINAYPAVHAMARNYWGKRKFTPAHKMLESEGTFERAYTEMKWAGKLPEFTRLLQSFGFNGQTTWMKLTKRISLAYAILRLNEIDPSHVEHMRDVRTRQLAQIEQERLKAQELPDGKRAFYLKHLREREIPLQQQGFAEKDAESLRPFYTRFDAMNNTIEEYRRRPANSR